MLGDGNGLHTYVYVLRGQMIRTKHYYYSNIYDIYITFTSRLHSRLQFYQVGFRYIICIMHPIHIICFVRSIILSYIYTCQSPLGGVPIRAVPSLEALPTPRLAVRSSVKSQTTGTAVVLLLLLLWEFFVTEHLLLL